jgi:hypothetical protein
MAYRNLTTNKNLSDAIEDTLLNNREYIICHLVKFERPIVDRIKDATSFAYFTDGPFDISFDDGTSNIINESNGAQLYRASTLKSVGDIKEATEAKASTTSIVLNSVAFGAALSDTLTITSSSITTSKFDLIKEGFREGDRVQLTSSDASAENRNQYIQLNTFSNDNKTVSYTTFKNSTIEDETGKVYSITLSNTEISAFVDNKTVTSYTSYLNRDVFIYRALLDPATGITIGEPFLLFRGLIAGGKLNETPEKSSTMTWTLTSHWGNFVKVEGRRGVDSAHRLLAAEKLRSSVQSSEYRTDLGFVHSTTSLSVNAQYQTREERFRIKKKKKWTGKKTKVKRYYVDVDRSQRLDFNLDQEYIPVVYGVQKVESNPVFADILKKPTSTVLFKINTLCEGEISGILNIIDDDKSLVCLNAEDQLDRYGYDTFSNSNDTQAATCFGRMDQGDTLNATTILQEKTTGVSTTAAAACNDSTTLEVASSSNISAGASVEYTGGSEDLYVTNVSGTTLTLNENATIANGTALKFKHQYPRYVQSFDVSFIHTGGITNILNITDGLAPQPIYDGSVYFGHEKALGHVPTDTMWQLHAGKSDQDANHILSSVAQGYNGNGKGTIVCTNETNARKFQVGRSYIIESGSEVVGNNGVPFTVLSINGSTLTIRFAVTLIKSIIKLFRRKKRTIYYPTKNLTASTQNETYTIRRYAGPTTKKASRFYRTKRKTSGSDTFTADITETTTQAFGDAAFSIQQMYYNNQDNNYDYWGENHRLLDTAYTMSITHGNPLEDSQDAEYIVKGKFIDCHNYDNSYDVTDSTDIGSFKAGDLVDIGTNTNLQQIQNLVCATAFKLNGVEKLILGNREFANGVFGTRLYVLNQSTNIREETANFYPYLFKDIWVDATGTYLWAVESSLSKDGILGTVSGGRVRRFNLALGDNAATNATLTATHDIRLGGMYPSTSEERLIEPGAIWGDGDSLFVYYPATVASPSMPANTDNIESFAQITTQKGYITKWDIANHTNITNGEFPLGDLPLISVVDTGQGKVPFNAATLDGNPNLNTYFWTGQPNFSYEEVIDSAVSMATDGNTVWVLDKQADRAHSFLNLSSDMRGASTQPVFTGGRSFNLSSRENISSQYFDVHPNDSSTWQSNSDSTCKFGTGNIYAYEVATGKRQPEKDINITADNIIGDSPFVGRIPGIQINDNYMTIQRDSGSGIPKAGDVIQDLYTSGNTINIHATNYTRNLSKSSSIFIEHAMGLPDGITNSNAGGFGVGSMTAGTYVFTPSDYTVTPAVVSTHEPNINITFDSSGTVTNISSTQTFSSNAVADAQLFEVGSIIQFDGTGVTGVSSSVWTEEVTSIRSWRTGASWFNVFTNRRITSTSNTPIKVGTLGRGAGNRASYITYNDNKLYILNTPLPNIGNYRYNNGVGGATNKSAWVDVWDTTNKNWREQQIVISGGANLSTTRVNQNFVGITADDNYLYVGQFQNTDKSSRYNPVPSEDLKYPKVIRYNLSTSAYDATQEMGYLPADPTNILPYLDYQIGLSILPGVTQSDGRPVFVTVDAFRNDNLGYTTETDPKIFVTNHGVGTTYSYNASSATFSTTYDFALPSSDLRGIDTNYSISSFTFHDDSTDKLLVSYMIPGIHGHSAHYHKQYHDASLFRADGFTISDVFAFTQNNTTSPIINKERTSSGMGGVCYEDYGNNIVVFNKATTAGQAATNSSALIGDTYYAGGNRFRLGTPLLNDHSEPAYLYIAQATVSNSPQFVVSTVDIVEIGNTFYNGTTGHTVTGIGFTEATGGQLHGAAGTASVNEAKDGTTSVRCFISENISNVADVTIVVNDRTGLPTTYPFAAILEHHDAYLPELIQVTSLNGNEYTVVRNIGYKDVFNNTTNSFKYEANKDFISIPKELVVFEKTSGDTPDTTTNRDNRLFLEITSTDANNKYLSTLDDGSTPPIKVQHIGLMPNNSDHYAILLSSPITIQANRAAKLGHRTNITVSPNISINQNDTVYAATNNAINYYSGSYGGESSDFLLGDRQGYNGSSFDWFDRVYRGLVLRESEYLYFVGSSNINGIAYSGGTNVVDEVPDGGTSTATIKSIKKIRKQDDTIGSRVSFLNSIPDLGTDSIIVTSQEDPTKNLTLDSGDIFPALSSTQTLDSVDSSGGTFTSISADSHSASGVLIDLSSNSGILGLPLDITDTTYEELGFGKIKAISANFGGSLNAANQRESSSVASFKGSFGLKTLSTLREEETLVYVKNSSDIKLAYAKVFDSPSSITKEEWKTSDAFIYPYTVPAIEFNAATKVNDVDETIELTASEYANLSENERVTYSNNGNSNIGGLTSGYVYYVHKVASTTKIKLALAYNGSSTSDYSTSYMNLSTPISGTHKLTPEEKLVVVAHEQSTLYNSEPTAFNSSIKLCFEDIIRLNEAAVPNVNSDELIGLRTPTGQTSLSQVVAFDYSSRMAMIKDHNISPSGSTTYKLFRKNNRDLRVSINPAIQLLDYLTNDVYGKGLDIDTEIDLDSFKDAARLCDAESNVTLIAPKIHPQNGNAVASPTIGQVWESAFNSGRHSDTPNEIRKGHFIGTVAAINSRTVDEKDYWEITFSSVVGKIGRKWNNWQGLEDNYIWNNGGAFWGPHNTASGGTTISDRVNLGGGTALTTDPTSSSGNRDEPGGAPIKFDSGILSLKTSVDGDSYNVGDNLFLDTAKNGVVVTIDGDQSISSGASASAGVNLTVDSTTGVEVGMYFYHINRYLVVTEVSSATVLKFTSPSKDSVGTFTNNTSFALTSPITDPNRVSFEGNPFVKAFDEETGTFSKNGYSLYDCDDITYWRYLGWDEKEQHMVTRHQTNISINTANTVFDNVNTLLQQFNGILTYRAGKYHLGIKTTKAPDVSLVHDSNTFTPSHITEDQIIGKIDITDKGAKNSFNTMTSKIIDPYKLFGETEINFFNSDYLTQDNNVPKEGNFAMPGVTNYFNARMGVKQELDSSRFSLDITFTMAPEGILLNAGDIITISYQRFGFDRKEFRIESLTLKSNGLVTVLASEHSDSVYVLEYDATTSTDTGKNTAGQEIKDPTI